MDLHEKSERFSPTPKEHLLLWLVTNTNVFSSLFFN